MTSMKKKGMDIQSQSSHWYGCCNYRSSPTDVELNVNEKYFRCMNVDDVNAISFSELTKLLEHIHEKGWFEHHLANKAKLKETRDKMHMNIYTWLKFHKIHFNNHYHHNYNYFPILRLMLPHLDTDRKYGFQEKGLLNILLMSNAFYTEESPQLKRKFLELLELDVQREHSFRTERKVRSKFIMYLCA